MVFSIVSCIATGSQDWLKNLYFLYLLELRALQKSEPYLLTKVNWQVLGVGSTTPEAIKDLLKVVKYVILCNHIEHLILTRFAN